jgi:hypothetical protein
MAETSAKRAALKTATLFFGRKAARLERAGTAGDDCDQEQRAYKQREAAV